MLKRPENVLFSVRKASGLYCTNRWPFGQKIALSERLEKASESRKLEFSFVLTSKHRQRKRKFKYKKIK